MKSFIRLASAAMLLGLGAPLAMAEGWHQDFVKTVYPLSNGNFVVIFVSSPSSCPNANNPKYFYVQVGNNGVTSDGAKAMLATALTAFTTGRKLTVAFDDASASCDVNRMSVSD
jgi:hypothetical protein